MKTLLNAIICLVSLVLYETGEAKSSGFSSSSSRSSYSSSSSSRSSSSYTPSKSSSTPSANKSSTSSSSKSWNTTPQTSTRKTSSVEAAKYQAAVKSGKTFNTKESAIADFKATKASSYKSTFTSEPTTRPSYIPTTYRSGNTNHTVIYNQSYGGYGYWSGGGPGLGTFMLYDLLQDQMMLNTVMSRDNYYVGPPPADNKSDSDSSCVTGCWVVVILTIVILGVIILIGCIRFVD